MRAFLVYTAARLALLLAVAALLYAVGFRGLVLVALALLATLPLSYVLLRRQREALTDAVAARVERQRALRRRLDGDAPHATGDSGAIPDDEDDDEDDDEPPRPRPSTPDT